MHGGLCYTMRMEKFFCLVLVACIFSACIFEKDFAKKSEKHLEESALVESQKGLAMERFEPPEALMQIATWYPKDWRLHFFQGLIDSSRDWRLKELKVADSLKPNQALVAYQIAAWYLESDSLQDYELALGYINKAQKLDPENAILQVMAAYAQLRMGQIPKARALFLDTRLYPGGDFYFPQMEKTLLGLFSHSQHLNPYTLTEAVEIYRRIPFPPFENWVNILCSVFIDSLDAHPYDIRLRGRDAAHEVFLLGKKLRSQSYRGPRVFSDGWEQNSMGFLFQLKAGEFQTYFYKTFPDSLAAAKVEMNLQDVLLEYDAFQKSQPWQDSLSNSYLQNWSELIQKQPSLPLSQAIEKARGWGLWQRIRLIKYIASDEGGEVIDP